MYAGALGLVEPTKAQLTTWGAVTPTPTVSVVAPSVSPSGGWFPKPPAIVSPGPAIVSPAPALPVTVTPQNPAAVVIQPSGASSLEGAKWWPWVAAAVLGWVLWRQ